MSTEQGSRELGGDTRPGHTGAYDDRVARLRDGRQRPRGAPAKVSVVRSGHANNPGLRNRKPERDCGLVSNGEACPSSSHPQGRAACQDRGAGNGCAACNHQNGAAVVFVAILRRLRQREVRQGLRRQGMDAHRAATGASGAVVTGAPLSRRGATKL